MNDSREKRTIRPRAGRARLAIVLGLACLLGAGALHAKDWGYDLGGELMSPFCPGRTLASCPSPQAAELVQWIVTQEAAGATREEVLDVLVERYGEEILGAPPAEGITLWAYVFPVVGFLMGGVVAFIVLRRIVKRSSRNPHRVDPLPSPVPAQASGGDDELARIVDAELAGRS